MAKTKGQPFRSSAVKTTKAKYLKDESGFFRFTCGQCKQPALYRKRQVHAERAKCQSCRGIGE